MKFQTFVLGCALALTLFLFGKQRHTSNIPSGFRSVVDLTQSVDLIDPGRMQPDKDSGKRGTYIEAPAKYSPSLWTVDRIPPGRLIAPLVVLDVRESVKKDPNHGISVEDIVSWEQVHGQIPMDSIAIARTGLAPSGRDTKFPGYSEDAAKFLVEARNVLALGADTRSISLSDPYALSHSVYRLDNVANLDQVPGNGAVIVVSPMKLEGKTAGPVRVLALVK
jgi:kynurenine formamidase